jgi:hypothetical protein
MVTFSALLSLSDLTSSLVVKSGDTCDEVSSVAGINSTILWANNPQIDSQCSNIYIGEVRLSSGFALACMIDI